MNRKALWMLLRYIGGWLLMTAAVVTLVIVMFAITPHIPDNVSAICGMGVLAIGFFALILSVIDNLREKYQQYKREVKWRESINQIEGE